MGCLRLTYWQKSLGLKVEKGNLNPLSNSSAGVYRYGFNGMEKDDSGNSTTKSDKPKIKRSSNVEQRAKKIQQATHNNKEVSGQAGAFSKESGAKRRKKKLEKNGVKAWIVRENGLYKVRINRTDISRAKEVVPKDPAF